MIAETIQVFSVTETIPPLEPEVIKITGIAVPGEGRSPEIQIIGEVLSWRLEGDSDWIDLFDLSTLTGGGGGAPSGAAGGDLGGTYPNPSFAVDMATQAELNTETTVRSDADSALQANIDTEITDRSNADSVLQDAIDAESIARANADTALAGSITTEVTARTNADTAEATARANGDALLIPLSQKGAVSGVATLDLAGTIPDGQIPASITRDTELTAAIQTAINGLLAGAPAALDTLKELADAINDDASFAASVTAALATKVDKSTLTTDGDLLTRAAGAITRVTRASLATDAAWATVYVALTDARLTDTRIPTDASVTPAKFAASAIDPVAGTAGARTLGNGAQQAVSGTDARLSDTRTPTDSTVTPAKFAASAIDPVAGTAGARTLGNGAQQAVSGTDARLSDARTPTAHHTTHESGGTDAITIAESQVTNLVADLAAKASASLALGGRLSGTLPNPTIPPGTLTDTDINSAAGISRTKIAAPAAWTTPGLTAGWHSLSQDFAGFEPIQYRLDPLGERVFFKGVLYAQQATANGVVPWTLPTGYRPAASVLIPTVWFDSSANARKVANIQIASTGTVSVQADAAVDTGDQIYLAGLTFSIT